MAYDPTDATTARSLLEDALMISKPALTAEQFERALALASSLDEDGTEVYLAADLDKAAAWGWGIKAGLTADQYDVGVGTGKTFDRAQWHAHCKAMQRDYQNGTLSVTGEAPGRASGLRSVRLFGSAAGEVGR